jgi:hypothetical protein
MGSKNKNKEGQASEQEITVGTLCMCSFVRNGTFYQILRIEGLSANDDAAPEEPADADELSHAHLKGTKPGQSLTFSFGGEVRFGCANARQNYQGRSLGSGNDFNGKSGTRDHLNELSGDTESRGKDDDAKNLYLVEATEDRHRLSCIYEAHNTRMDIQLFINQMPTALSGPTGGQPKSSKNYANTGTEHSVPLGRKPSTVVMAISLNAMGKHVLLDSCRSWKWVAKYLDVNRTAELPTTRIWRESYEDRLNDEIRLDGDGRWDDEDRLEMRIVANCVERTLTVSSVPRMSQNPAALT